MVKHKIWRGLSLLDAVTGASRFYDSRGSAVVMYHSVGDPEKFGNISPDRFRHDLEFFSDEYEIVDLPDILSRRDDAAKLAVTFDDGYGNFHTEAYPILREFDFPATVFLTSEFLTQGTESRIRSRHDIPTVDDETMMTPDQVESLLADGLVTIGNHTRTHPDLSSISDEDRLRDEIVGAKRELESMFGVEIDRFSYPHGAYSQQAVDVVRDSHSFGVCSDNHLLYDGANRYVLPRIRGHNPRYQLEWELSGLSERCRNLFEMVT